MLDDGTRVSAETLRRVTCDAAVVGGISDAFGTPLDVGRRTRSIPPALRRALRLRDGGCRFPGCTNRTYVHGHHIRHWLHGGETRLDHVVLLCGAHHRLVHEGGFDVSVDAERGLVFTGPGGRVFGSQPPVAPVSADEGSWWAEWTESRQLDLGPATNDPLWDGSPPQYDAVVDAIVAASG